VHLDASVDVAGAGTVTVAGSVSLGVDVSPDVTEPCRYRGPGHGCRSRPMHNRGCERPSLAVIMNVRMPLWLWLSPDMTAAAVPMVVVVVVVVIVPVSVLTVVGLYVAPSL
jgi:hypothetical protein